MLRTNWRDGENFDESDAEPIYNAVIAIIREYELKPGSVRSHTERGYTTFQFWRDVTTVIRDATQKSGRSLKPSLPHLGPGMVFTSRHLNIICTYLNQLTEQES